MINCEYRLVRNSNNNGILAVSLKGSLARGRRQTAGERQDPFGYASSA